MSSERPGASRTGSVRLRGRPPNTAARREQIIDALLSVMARRGYESATITLVAREARLAPGLIHYHFASKQQILVALVDRLVRRRDQRLAARLLAAGDHPRERLFAFIDAHVALGSDADPRTVAAWVMVGAEAVRQPEVRALYKAAIGSALAQVRALVAECLRAQGSPARSAPRMAAAILSAIEGAFLIHVSAPGTLPEGYAAPTLRRMAEGLLAGEAE